MKLQHIIGADLSKRTIDFFCHLLKTHVQIENTVTGFKDLLNWLGQCNINPSETMIVMEHTGLYSYRFEHFLHQHQIAFVKVPALAIMRSMGLVRGKSDKMDARRIAEYGFEKRAKLIEETPVSADLKRLQMLYAAREHLVRQRAGLLNSLKEYSHIGLSKQDAIIQAHTRLIQCLGKQIDKLEDEMDGIIQGDPSLKKNHSLLQSIKGVGKLLAIATIIKTRNFTRFANARKFACYCGTAPFENTSGTSIRGKTKVSHLADKRMKSLLDLAAKSAIQHDKELHQYYQRRTSDGKPKMSTINIVRNKLICRMFAVIKRKTPFVENYLQVA